MCSNINSQVFPWATDRGTVQKVIVLPKDDLQTEELVLEEVEVFKVSTHCLSSVCLSLSLPISTSIFNKDTLEDSSMHCLHIPGSNSNYNNEDFVQKGKHVCISLPNSLRNHLQMSLFFKKSPKIVH